MAPEGRGWHPFLAERGSPPEGVGGTGLQPRSGRAREGQPLLSLARRIPRPGRTRASGLPEPQRTAIPAEMLVGDERSRARCRQAWGSSDLQGTHRDDVPAPWPFTERARRVVRRIAAMRRVLEGYAPAHATPRRRLRLLGPSSSWGRSTKIARCVPQGSSRFHLPSWRSCHLPRAPSTSISASRLVPLRLSLLAGRPRVLPPLVDGDHDRARFTRAIHSP